MIFNRAKSLGLRFISNPDVFPFHDVKNNPQTILSNGRETFLLTNIGMAEHLLKANRSGFHT